MQLVGRRREIDQINGLLERSVAGSGGLLVIVGPKGSGKSALVDLAVEQARHHAMMVLRASPPVGQPGRLLWSQLLRDVGAPDDVAARLLDPAHLLDLDSATRVLASSTPRLMVIDDIDRGGSDAVEVLSILAARLGSTSTVVLTTASGSLGVGNEVRLGPLSNDDLRTMLGNGSSEVGRAIGIASGGIPGVARLLATEVEGLADHVDPVVHLALTAASNAQFLAVDGSVVRLLELALTRSPPGHLRAQILAKLAHELLGDASASAWRHDLIDEALLLARQTSDPAVLAEVLEARLHALWEPATDQSRLAAAEEIIKLSRRAGDSASERRGLFWRFVALIELARVAEAESVLAAFEADSSVVGDTAALVMVTARHAMLAIMRGSYDEARRLIEEVEEQGRAAGISDAGQVVSALQGAMAMERGTQEDFARSAEQLLAYARHQPGHYYEATAASVLAMAGQVREAGAELERVLPRVLSGSGPRWLGALASLAIVATGTREVDAASLLYDALLPFDGRLVVSGGAVMILPPAAHFLGLLAGTLGRTDDAVAHFTSAIALEEKIGALPHLSHSLIGLADVLATRGGKGDRAASVEQRRRAQSIAERLGMTVLLARVGQTATWRLLRDGEDWLLEAGDEQTRLRDSRGLHYLRSLLAAPGQDITTLDLIARGAGLVASSTGEVVDGAARIAYRDRLISLEAQLDLADQAGDAEAAERIAAERAALVLELRRAVGLGGRTRVGSPESERARVNVTRTLRAALDRIAEGAPEAGAHLNASIATGTSCRYTPAPGGPPGWQF